MDHEVVGSGVSRSLFKILIQRKEDVVMCERILTDQNLVGFRKYLLLEEKSPATVDKYLRDVRTFLAFAGKQVITKDVTVAFKKSLEEAYAIRSVNSMLAALNCVMEFMGWGDCKVKTLKQQLQTYCSEEKELTRNEYMRLLEAAKEKEQLYLVMQTICGTGIRVSELKYFTVGEVRRGEVSVRCKSKTRVVLVPEKLKKYF